MVNTVEVKFKAWDRPHAGQRLAYVVVVDGKDYQEHESCSNSESDLSMARKSAKWQAGRIRENGLPAPKPPPCSCDSDKITYRCEIAKAWLCPDCKGRSSALYR